MVLTTIILRTSNPSGLRLWCVIGFFAGLGLFFYGFRLLQRRRLILDTPFSKIRSAPMGLVEISGLATGPYTMIAPITARQCYYYRTLVWEWKQSGKNKQWVKVAGECMHVPFFVDDNTGRMLIDPRGAHLDLHRDFEQEFCDSFFTTKEPAPSNVRSFLARHGIVTNNKIKVEEFCIKPKNSLFILGTLTENPGIEVGPTPIQAPEATSGFSANTLSFSLGSFTIRSGSSDDDPPPEFHSQPPTAQFENRPPLLSRVPSPSPATKADPQRVASALMKAGISGPAAWSAAGLSAAGAPALQPIPDPSQQAATFELHPLVVLGKGITNKTFLISWRSQQEVARSLGWKCTLMIWGGPALALLSLYVFLSIERLL